MAYVFAVLILVAGLELLLSGTWNSAYFRFGVPLFRYSVEHRVPVTRLPDASGLMSALPKSGYVPLRVHELDPVTYAVREAFWGGMSKIYYTAIMRWVLELSADGSIRIVGKANWFALGFTGSVAAMGLTGLADVGLSIILIGLVVFIYSVQAHRFRKVAEIACAQLRKQAA